MSRWVLVASAVVAIAGIAQLGPVALVALTVGVAIATLAIVAVRIAQLAHGHPAAWRDGWVGAGSGVTLLVLSAVAAITAHAGLSTLLGVSGAVVTAWGLIRLLHLRLPGAAVFDVLAEVVLVVGAVALLLTAVTGQPPTTYLAVLRDAGLIWVAVRLSGLTDSRLRVLDYTLGALVVVFLTDAALVWERLDPAVTINDQLVAVPLWALVLVAAGSLHPSLASRFADVSPARSTEVRGSHLAIVLGVVVLGPGAVLLHHASVGAPGPAWFVLGGLGLPLVAASHLVRQLHLRVKREYRAHHDVLTGLANRQVLGDRLSNELAHARRGRDRVAVLMLDLDRFKTINDSLGHDVGDALLVAIAKRLEASVREVDTVARLGGDEFAIVMPGIDHDQDALTVARKIRDVFIDAFQVGDRNLFVGTSIGIALGPDDSGDARQLLKKADTAMYRAKAEGGGSIQFFTAEMSDRARVRLSLEGSLRSAIASGQFELSYQPQIDVDSRRIVALEALVRWNHPVLGTITPGGFVPLAEETGAIIELGEWVLQTACDQLAHWHELGLLSVPVAVNVSAAQVVREPLHELVERVLERSGLPGHLLEIELTETALFRDIEGISGSLERLHEQGVRCAIDDFGSGYGGLTYLTRIPIDVLKIDRSFVAELEADPRAAVVVDAILAMADSLGVEIVAEGVETPDQAAWLRARGCRRMQGFRYARPIPRREMTRALVHASVGRSAGWEVTVSSLLAADPDTAPIPAHPGLEQARVNAVLAETARGHRGSSTDPDSLDAVLALLFPDEDRASRTKRALDGVPARLALGTFAGLLPLTTGLATVDDLADDARAVVTTVFDSVGVSRPAPIPTDGLSAAASDGWIESQAYVLPTERMDTPADGPQTTDEPEEQQVATGPVSSSGPSSSAATWGASTSTTERRDEVAEDTATSPVPTAGPADPPEDVQPADPAAAAAEPEAGGTEDRPGNAPEHARKPQQGDGGSQPPGKAKQTGGG